jgi:hypothetical protein
MHKKHITPLHIKEYSGYAPKPGMIRSVKKHHYFIITDITISGDAPKDFISYYHYGEGLKSKPNTWPKFIAKHGHKHYPAEVITEYLLNRIGEVLGFNMAKSELAWLGGQIRFLSRYFLDKPNKQVLEHGADLYAGYLSDREFVEEIEKEHQSPDFFTVSFTEETIKYFFPHQYKELTLEFIKLLFLDILIGNNDRHFYNWGIIRNVDNNVSPAFSPIYDTARGLFWNVHEDVIDKKLKNARELDKFIKSYCDNSSPKIGCEHGKISHFDLARYLMQLENVQNCEFIRQLCSNNNLSNIFSMIDQEFSLLITPNRKTIIKKTLTYRFETVQNIITFAS